MALFISFGLSKPSLKRFTLFAQGKVPVWSLSLGVISIIRFDYPFMRAFSDFADGSRQWDALLVEHAEPLRAHRRKVVSKARRQAESRAADQVAHWKDAYERYFAESARLGQENYRLNQAVEALAEKLSKRGAA